ncbi:MAG: TlpA family protein disulfide reductase [Bacteroidales bacterium]|nr:TlpA family protein disulfide reductase [Bacteroidales bacterium]
MKRLYLLVFSLIMIVGCGESKKPASDVIKLNISVESPVAESVVVVHHNDIHEIALDQDGKAVLELSGVDAAYLTLYHGREMLKLYAEGGDNAVLSFKGGDMLGSYSLEGGKSAATKYLNNVKLLPLPDEDYALQFEEYKSRLADKEKDALRLLKAGDLSEEGEFLTMEEARIRYSYGAALMMYPVGHMTGDMSYAPDQAYYDHIATYVVEDESLVNLDEYLMFVAEAMHMLDAANRDVTAIYPKTVAQIKYAADHLTNAVVKESLIHHITTTYVDNFGVKDIDELNNLYYVYVKDPALQAIYQAKCERWDLSRPGRVSPNFRAVDIEGKEWTLLDFRGKYVYIDMWATWCGPCKQEMPYLKQLEKQFEDASIVFLGLSVDRDKSKWEEMVGSGNLTGVQLYLGTQSSFQEAYRAESIPRFILLDKDGVIISNDMSRPSDPETAETLNALEGIR